MFPPQKLNHQNSTHNVIKSDLPKFLTGDSRQHLWGALGILQTRHIFWDQRSACLTVAEDLQDHKVSAGWLENKASWVCLPLYWIIICLLTSVLGLWMSLCWTQRWCLCVGKVLGVSEEPGCVSDELYEVYHQFAFSALSLHCGLCPSGHAAVWWEVRFDQFQHLQDSIAIAQM